MSQSHGGANRQRELFARSKSPVVVIEENHRLVQLTEELDWTDLEDLVQQIRMSKLKNAAGRPPELRALIGAMVFRATRKMTYRETEDQIRHYAPARYLCALTETDWTPDANTIQDFEELMGEEGTKLLNEYVVKRAVEKKLADPTVAAADTTAQEAAIPYPNEMGLMASFLSSVVSASRKAGAALKAFVTKTKGKVAAAKQKFREYRLFAKSKSKKVKDEMTAQMATLVERVQQELGQALKAGQSSKRGLEKFGKVAFAKVTRLHQTISQLIPQIRYWLKTGHVAADKIISIHIPQLYSIVRGKVGKAVEFGLNWGVTRLRGGFLLATVAANRRELLDTHYAVKAVEELIGIFGKAPNAYAYDRGGHSAENLRRLKKLGVRNLGLAPRGRTQWAVGEQTREKLVAERAKVEGGIGAVKNTKYGFNRPTARSAAMMAMCGQRAVLGFNLNKLVRELAKRRDEVLVG
jgi:hypothetical protein